MAEATGATTSAPPAESGPRTDRLELLQQCGGTVGAVHKARNPKLNRVVALRQLQVPDWLDDAEDLIKRILADARNAGALDHPNIARLLTAGYKGFTVFLTSEFVEGQNIKDYVAAQKLGIPQIVGLARQLCLALDYAHEKKIVHYALTPSNLKVLPDGTLKILDFGLLREKQLYSPTPAKRLESEHYLSPEQIRNKPVDLVANLFSAATIIYELLTTRNPFAGKHLGEVDRNITDLEPTPASAAHSRVPEAISKVLTKALAKNPSARFQTAAELGNALEEAANGTPAKPASLGAAKAYNDDVSASNGSLSSRGPLGRREPAGAGAKVPVNAVSVAQPPTSPTPAANGTAAAAPPKPAPVIPITSAKPAAVKPIPAPSPASQSKPQASSVPPTMVLPAVRPASGTSIPAKILGQWKLVGAAVVIVFVVSAMAISFNHRSRVSSKPADAPQATEQQEVAVAGTPGATQPEIEVREVTPRAGKPKVSKTEPSPMPVAMTTGQLAITSIPDGATISVEGHTTQSWQTPQVLDSLAPGTYKVTLSKSGYASETRNIEIVAGNRASLDIRLNAVKASLTVAGTPSGARILIDGKDTGRTSPAEFSLDPAVHNIALHMEGYFDSATDLKLAAGQTVSYSPTLKPAGRTDNIKIVGGGFKKIFGGGSSEGMSRLEIKSEPKGAQVIVNGSTLSKTTPLEIQLEPGNYDITLQKEGFNPVHKSVSTQANQKLKIEETLAK
jgi:serine/threonine-protein kinase